MWGNTCPALPKKVSVYPCYYGVIINSAFFHSQKYLCFDDKSHCHNSHKEILWLRLYKKSKNQSQMLFIWYRRFSWSIKNINWVFLCTKLSIFCPFEWWPTETYPAPCTFSSHVYFNLGPHHQICRCRAIGSERVKNNDFSWFSESSSWTFLKEKWIYCLCK